MLGVSLQKLKTYLNQPGQHIKFVANKRSCRAGNIENRLLICKLLAVDTIITINVAVSSIFELNIQYRYHPKVRALNLSSIGEWNAPINQKERASETDSENSHYKNPVKFTRLQLLLSLGGSSMHTILIRFAIPVLIHTTVLYSQLSGVFHISQISGKVKFSYFQLA